jgi:hypothetical protein
MYVICVYVSRSVGRSLPVGHGAPIRVGHGVEYTCVLRAGGAQPARSERRTCTLRDCRA